MNKFLHNERGVSLIEVVVSLLIITLILISFSGLLLQSKKSSISSEETLDDTYIAQQTMEYFYSYVQQSSSLEKLKAVVQADNNYVFNATTDLFESKTKDPVITVKTSYFIENGVPNPQLVFIVTEVKRQNMNASPVVMETVWRLGKEDQ